MCTRNSVFWDVSIWKYILTKHSNNCDLICIYADVIFFHDWYAHVKNPPFNAATAMSWSEGGGLNIGVMYFQNANPSGPVPWALAEAYIRNLRWLENTGPRLSLNVTGTCCCVHLLSLHDSWFECLVVNRSPSARWKDSVRWICLISTLVVKSNFLVVRFMARFDIPQTAGTVWDPFIQIITRLFTRNWGHSDKRALRLNGLNILNSDRHLFSCNNPNIFYFEFLTTTVDA